MTKKINHSLTPSSRFLSHRRCSAKRPIKKGRMDLRKCRKYGIMVFIKESDYCGLFCNPTILLIIWKQSYYRSQKHLILKDEKTLIPKSTRSMYNFVQVTNYLQCGIQHNLFFSSQVGQPSKSGHSIHVLLTISQHVKA